MHAQDDLNPHILCMFEGTFSLDAAHLIVARSGNSFVNYHCLLE